jgi:hypothetical protein
MQRLEVSGAVRPIYGSLGVKRLTTTDEHLVISISATYISRHPRVQPSTTGTVTLHTAPRFIWTQTMEFI